MDNPTPPSTPLPPQTPDANSGSNVFFVNVQDKNQLFRIYMPYITNGGLFVKTDKTFQLGEEVFLLVKLIDEPEKFTLAGKVVWITPANAQGGHGAGIGVQLGPDAAPFRAKIETYLAGALTADRQTDTM